jgi:hypothetical protein
MGNRSVRWLGRLADWNDGATDDILNAAMATRQFAVRCAHHAAILCIRPLSEEGEGNCRLAQSDAKRIHYVGSGHQLAKRTVRRARNAINAQNLPRNCKSLLTGVSQISDSISRLGGPLSPLAIASLRLSPARISLPKIKGSEPGIQDLHLHNRVSSAHFGRRNHDSGKIHLDNVFINCSCSLGAV